MIVNTVRHPQKYQPGLFLAGDDVDVMAQRLPRPADKLIAVVCQTQSVSAHRFHVGAGYFPDTLAELAQGFQRGFRRLFSEVVVAVQPGGNTHHILEPVDDAHLDVFQFGHYHVEAVGAQVHRGKSFAYGGTHVVQSKTVMLYPVA